MKMNQKERTKIAVENVKKETKVEERLECIKDNPEFWHDSGGLRSKLYWADHILHVTENCGCYDGILLQSITPPQGKKYVRYDDEKTIAICKNCGELIQAPEQYDLKVFCQEHEDKLYLKFFE